MSKQHEEFTQLSTQDLEKFYNSKAYKAGYSSGHKDGAQELEARTEAAYAKGEAEGYSRAVRYLDISTYMGMFFVGLTVTFVIGIVAGAMVW